VEYVTRDFLKEEDKKEENTRKEERKEEKEEVFLNTYKKAYVTLGYQVTNNNNIYYTYSTTKKTKI
jgi:hypothetical protein